MLGTVDFEEETKGKSTNDKLQKFYDLLESTAALIFKTKKKYLNNQEEEKKPKNKIPKRVRKLMKSQKKLSTRILHKKMNWRTTMKLMEELEVVETEIENEYKTRKTKLENEAILKLKKDPKLFYLYAKKHSKS